MLLPYSRVTCGFVLQVFYDKTSYILCNVQAMSVIYCLNGPWVGAPNTCTAQVVNQTSSYALPR